MSLAPGTRLGPYEIAAQIGVGGMGEVYRATDTTLNRQVAIKVLPESLASASADSVLDAMLEQDPMSRVACETMVSTGMVVVAGEVTTKAYVEIPDVVKKGLNIIIASTVDEVLEHSLTKPLVPIEWNESDHDSQPVPASDDDSEASGVVRH